MIKTERVCRKCGEVNEINLNNLIVSDVYDEYGTHYRIMFYDCKRCGEREVVQIDSVKTLRIYRDLKKLILRTARKRGHGENIDDKAVRKKDRLMRDLREERESLQEMCRGKKLFDENKKVVVEQLTFSKVGDIIDDNL